MRNLTTKLKLGFLPALAALLFAPLLLASEAKAEVSPPGFAAGHASFVAADGHEWPVKSTITQGRATVDGKEFLTLTVRDQAIPVTSPTTRESFRIRRTSTAGGCVDDGAYVVTSCITQFYTQYVSGGRPYVAVDHYAYSWSRNDSQFAFRSGNMHMGVYGRCGTGCSGTLTNKADCNNNPPSNLTTYTCNPSWSGSYVDVSTVPGYQCGNSSVVMTRGGSSYTFRHDNICQGRTN